MKEYWLYLDSYTALFKDSHKVVLYNTLQKKVSASKPVNC